MTTIAILCSGQGAQGASMFDLTREAPEAAEIFAAATEVLDGRDPREIAKSGDDDEMHLNAVAQVLCCAQALAVWAVLQPRLDARLVVAGYSVGEVAAWGVAGALRPTAALHVVAKRAALMDSATSRASGLLAVRGLSCATVERLCTQTDVHIAIRNAPDHVVLGGSRDALMRARAAAESSGAKRISLIPVGVASHTPLLRGAADRFRSYLHSLDEVRAPKARLLSGIDGSTVLDVGEGIDKLARQVAQTVDWAACLEACQAFGATKALELGPGNALARMMGDVIGEQNSRSTADFRTIDGVLRWIGRAV